MTPGGSLKVVLNPHLMPMPRAQLEAWQVSSVPQAMEFCARLDPPSSEELYGGNLSLMLTFTSTGLRGYQFVVGGPSETWEIALSRFSTLPGYVESMNSKLLLFQFSPEELLFMSNQPHSEWKRLIDMSYNKEQIADLGELDLSAVLVRLAVIRTSQGNFTLVLEAILEHKELDLATMPKKNPWCLTTQAQPVALMGVDVWGSVEPNSQLEIMPVLNLTDDNCWNAVSDASIRFAVLRALLDASTNNCHPTFDDWLQFARKKSHRYPQMDFMDDIPFPVSQFSYKHGAKEMLVIVGGQPFMISKDDDTLVRPVVDSPPPAAATQPAPSQSAVAQSPALRSRAASSTAPQADVSADQDVEEVEVVARPTKQRRTDLPPVTSAPTAVSAAPAIVSQSAGTAPAQPSTQGKRSYVRSAKSMSMSADKLPAPTKKHKYSPSPALLESFPPDLPPHFAMSLSAAWSSDRQKRMENARNLFVKILQRDPFLKPQRFDLIYIMDYLIGKGLAAATVNDYVSIFNNFLTIHGHSSQNVALIRQAVKGHGHTMMDSFKKAATPLSVPFSFDALKLIAEGLRTSDMSPILKAATWSCCLALFWGLLRSGELLCPNKKDFDVTKQFCLSDLKFNPDRSAQLWLKNPKVQTERGDVVELLYLEILTDFCPIRALHNYLQFRAQITSDADYPLFLLARGSPLTCDQFRDTWKKALSRMGVPDFTIRCHRNHGFRSSLPSLLQLSDLDVAQIKCLGRWSSDAYLTYLKDNEARRQARLQALSFCEKLGLAQT